MVSREDHCLSDLLWRWRNGHLGGEIVTVISNHDDLRGEVEAVGLPFHHVPISPRDAGGGRAAGAGADRRRSTCSSSPATCRSSPPASSTAVGAPAINIHHSFLPAFVGADPYARAHERGVKLIGATAHYVTAELDAGPIIDQDVVRVGHADEVPDLVRIGRDVERIVLARAVTAHLEDRVLIDGERHRRLLTRAWTGAFGVLGRSAWVDALWCAPPSPCHPCVLELRPSYGSDAVIEPVTKAQVP